MSERKARTGIVCLEEGWQVQSSAALSVGGAELSRPGAGTDPAARFYQTRLPATVLGTLVDAGAVPDPFVGDNYLKLEGRGPHAQNFANHPMPPDSPYAVSWWFRRDFQVPDDAGPFVRLRFDGLNYRANVWVNGKLVAGAQQLAGAYRIHELDVTALVDRAGDNAVAVEVFAPGTCDLALSWVDWNPSPPDKNLGLWRDVWVRSSGPVSVEDPFLDTRVPGAQLARVTLRGDLVNHDSAPRTATVHAAIEGRHVQHTVTLAPSERRAFAIGPDRFPELVFHAPRLWWPRPLGEPALCRVELEVEVDGARSDALGFDAGLREVTCEVDADGGARFSVNGEPLLLRGAGWACDLFLRRDRARDHAQLEYVKAMGLNTVRFEGMLERAELLEQCDREGLMVIAGWVCCDCWEKWDQWHGECHEVAPLSLRDQIRRVRRHPSIVTWMYGSDFPPPPDVERKYLEVFASEGWPNPTHSSAAAKPTEVTGVSGMKMLGPYEWVPPGYWTSDSERGGAFGFATEISPGPAIPPLESLEKMLGKDHLWPPDDVWKLHAGGQEFHDLSVFLDALAARYGAPASAADLARWSQVACYEAQRAMFEAYTVRWPRATGVIQWMLNNAWPSLIWHLFDWYLRPGGGFFGSKKACAPLAAIFTHDDRGVWVVNERRRALHDLEVRARVLDARGEQVFEAIAAVDVAERTRVRALVLPPVPEPMGFVDLRVSAAGQGAALADNFYWLSATPDVLDFAQGSWRYTPCTSFGDLSALRRLPAASVGVRVRPGGPGQALVELEHTGGPLAFFVQARLTDAAGQDLLPVVWTDNYVSILPGEKKWLAARLVGGVAETQGLHVEISGPNVATTSVPVTRESGPVRVTALAEGGLRE